MACSNCRESGHNIRTCPYKQEETPSFSSPPRSRRTVHCSICGEPGHNKRTCIHSHQSTSTSESDNVLLESMLGLILNALALTIDKLKSDEVREAASKLMKVFKALGKSVAADGGKKLKRAVNILGTLLKVADSEFFKMKTIQNGAKDSIPKKRKYAEHYERFCDQIDEILKELQETITLGVKKIEKAGDSDSAEIDEIQDTVEQLVLKCDEAISRCEAEFAASMLSLKQACRKKGKLRKFFRKRVGEITGAGAAGGAGLGAAGGATGGALAGAVVGSIVPGAGTIAGGFLGGVIGGVVGVQGGTLIGFVTPLLLSEVDISLDTKQKKKIQSVEEAAEKEMSRVREEITKIRREVEGQKEE